MLKILIPVDASSTSRCAVRHVIRRAWGGESLDIHLLHVQPRSSRNLDALELAGELLERAGLRYTACACFGDPARQIVRFAESHRFESIVMACARPGSLCDLMLGSVSAKVLRASRIPVELVPASPHKRKDNPCSGIRLMSLQYWNASIPTRRGV